MGMNNFKSIASNDEMEAHNFINALYSAEIQSLLAEHEIEIFSINE